MTLPMSLTLWAPVALMTSAIAAFASASDICCGQIGPDDLDLAALLVGEFLAAGLVVDFDRFLALLDHLLQEAEELVVGQHGLALPLRLDVGVLDRRIDQAQRRRRGARPAAFIAVFKAC